MYNFVKPEEQNYASLLQNSTILKTLMSAYANFIADNKELAALSVRNFPVNHITEPRVYRIYKTVLQNLNVNREIPLYITHEFGINAMLYGGDYENVIVLYNDALENLNDQQLEALLGREVGHIMCGHVKYMELIRVFDTIADMVPFIGRAAMNGVLSLLINWKKVAESTADRAGAIACGSAKVMESVILKSMGVGENMDILSVDENTVVLPENDEDIDIDWVGGMIYIELFHKMKCNFGNSRIADLRRWSTSNECKKNYPVIYFSRFRKEFRNKYILSGKELLYDIAEKMIGQNIDDAMGLFHIAAEQNEAKSHRRLGEIYIRGLYGVERDIKAGLVFLKKAALNGNANSAYLLGRFFWNGMEPYITQNRIRGYHFLRFAAEKQDMQAIKFLQCNSLEIASMPEPMKKYMRQYIENDSNHQYIYNNSNIYMGLSQKDCSVYKYVVKELFIPKNEIVYVIGFYKKFEEYMVAVCEYGLYVYHSQGIPQYIPWKLTLKEKISGKREYGEISILYRNDIIYKCDEKDMKGSVAGLIIKMIKNL